MTALRHVTVIEEAHRLLRQPLEGAGAGAAAKAVEMFADLLAEIRAYGEGIIIAEQIPTKLIVDVIKNTAVKLMHRLPAKDDREAVGLAMNMKEAEQEFVTTLLPGEAAAFADGMDFPVLIRLPDGSARESAGSRAPGVPDGLVTAGRPACPKDCAMTACTLRELSASAAIAAESRLALWAELAVVGHLTGNPVPRPGPALEADLKKLDRRRRDCAIAAAAATAVGARIPALAVRIAGPDLAAHCADAMRAFLDGRGRACVKDELEWIAPSYFWHRVINGLRSHGKEHPDEPHPLTRAWEDACGELLPGATCAQQAAIAQQRHSAARKYPAAVTTVLYGNRASSVIEDAVGGSAADPAWPGRLRTALTVFDGASWPLRHLTPESRSERG